MKKYKLIIVENDEDEQLFMRQGFVASGLFDIVVMVREGNELFEWLNQHSSALPDLILSDLNMPGKNGFEIIADIHKHPAYKIIPVIITSTSSIQSVIDQCLSMGAAGYVTKPDSFVEYAPFARRLHELVAEKNLA
ncbi:MAG: response regulator [Chitinophagaceae bacterium]|nr:response regulator [Chitinophagaceae bacterium]